MSIILCHCRDSQKNCFTQRRFLYHKKFNELKKASKPVKNFEHLHQNQQWKQFLRKEEYKKRHSICEQKTSVKEMQLTHNDINYLVKKLYIRNLSSTRVLLTRFFRPKLLRRKRNTCEELDVHYCMSFLGTGENMLYAHQILTTCCTYVSTAASTKFWDPRSTTQKNKVSKISSVASFP